MASTPSDDPAFIDGLDLDHLNPPDMKQFIQALPRRLDEIIQDLNERAPVESVVELLNFLVDELDHLIESVGAAGFPPDHRVEISLPDWSGQDNRAPALLEVRRRLETGASEAARRIGGIPNEGWRTNPNLLKEIRGWVGPISASLRKLSGVVESANAGPGSPGDPQAKLGDSDSIDLT